MHRSKIAVSFSHLVGAGEDCWRQLDAQRSGDAEVDPKIELGGTFERQVARLCAFQKLGLKVKTPARPVSKPGRRLRAQELATKAIEKIIDPSAPPEERAQRRRRLTKGPPEFREDRVDLPKAKGK
jgi:hypothetical protein